MASAKKLWTISGGYNQSTLTGNEPGPMALCLSIQIMLPP